MKTFSKLLPVAVALATLGMLLTSGPGAAGAQAGPGDIDLSQLVVDPEAIGDGWSVTSQRDEPTLFRTDPGAAAVAGYVVTYAQNPQVTASIALYQFPDHAGAVASTVDSGYFWGHGISPLQALSGLGDDQSYRVYPVSKGAASGITFVRGPIAAYVRAEDDGAPDTTGADATCDQLAAAEDQLLQRI